MKLPGNMQAMMQQAQKMQERMQKAQAELAAKEVEGQSGAGLVKITMTGKFAVKRVQIDPSLLAEDRDMLEDLIAAAVNDAVHRVEQMTQQEMGSLTAGMQLPPGMKLPF
jgi:nucleoid-associated protein EbfC